MTTIAQLAKRMQDVMYHSANQLAVETGFIQRQRVLTGASFVSGLVSGWQRNPSESLSGLSQAIGNAGTPLTRQGVNGRFDEAAIRFLEAMVEASLSVMVKGIPVWKGALSQFEGVVLTDSTIITLPNSLQNTWRGSGGYGKGASQAALKISVRWNVLDGALEVVSLSDGRQHDRRSPAHTHPVATGSLHVRDLGYFKLDDFESIAQQGAFWLTRYKTNTHILDLMGQTLDLPNWLPQQVGQVVDTSVLLGKVKQLPCRLVAERVPESVVQQRHEHLHEIARQNQTTPSARSLELAQWTLYLTNVSHQQLTPDQLFMLGRYRWQIELLFKLWKSDLQIDEWRTRNPHRILCELYAKLIAAIVSHWLLLIACWRNPRRSLRQAMPTIHAFAWQWANSLHSLKLLKHVLLALQRSLSKCSMDAVAKKPRHFQLLENLHA